MISFKEVCAMISYMLVVLFFVSFSSIFLFWLLLELNLLFYIMLVTAESSKSTESTLMFYFVIQSLGSFIFIIPAVFMMGVESVLMDCLLMFSVILKIGLFPTHSWVFSICKSLSWVAVSVLLCVQKIPLLIFMSSGMNHIMVWISLLSFMMGTIFLSSSYSPTDLMVSSSIYSMFWIIMIMMMGVSILFLYMTVYFIHLSNFLKSFSNSLSDQIWFTKIFTFFSFLFFLGLPPFSLFFFKFYVILNFEFLISSELFFIVWIFSFLSLIFYFKYFMSALTLRGILFQNSSMFKGCTLISVFIIFFLFGL